MSTDPANWPMLPDRRPVQAQGTHGENCAAIAEYVKESHAARFFNRPFAPLPARCTCRRAAQEVER